MTWSPEKSAAPSAQAKARWSAVCPGVASAVSVQPGPATTLPSPIASSGRKPASRPSPPPAANAGAGASGTGPRASTGAPARAAKARAPSLWSRWAWVTSTAATRSPATAALSAARWAGSAGPGSITATSPSPTT